jgi:cell division septum initiation protein DivIVA
MQRSRTRSRRRKEVQFQVATKSGEPAKTDSDPGVHQVLATTQERVAGILEATDRAAAEIVDAANAEAERVVAEAHAQATEAVNAKMDRISSLIEGVLAQAGTVDTELDQLRSLVRESTEALATELGIDAAAEPAEEARAAAPALEAAEQELAATVASVEEQVAELDETDDRAEAVKLLAIQMIATGHSAERASERLKSEFHVEDPAAVLASIGAPVNEE